MIWRFGTNRGEDCPTSGLSTARELIAEGIGTSAVPFWRAAWVENPVTSGVIFYGRRSRWAGVRVKVIRPRRGAAEMLFLATADQAGSGKHLRPTELKFRTASAAKR